MRCKCKTHEGRVCTRPANNGSYCWQHHENQSVVKSCNSTRKSGRKKNRSPGYGKKRSKSRSRN